MDDLISETGLENDYRISLQFLGLLKIDADEKLEARKRHFGLTITS
jgi:hypothetical protein